MKHKDCKGCKSFGIDKNNTLLWVDQHCELKPVFENKQCPCSTCLVKVTCTADDSECDMYYQFSKQQYIKIETKEEDIPCIECDKSKECVRKIIDLRIAQYGSSPELYDEDEDYMFHTEIMSLLIRECETMKKYFPFEVVSRDGMMRRPDKQYLKHWKADLREMVEEDEWGRRKEKLYGFFYKYNVHPSEGLSW
jgi:hypothetical protein